MARVKLAIVNYPYFKQYRIIEEHLMRLKQYYDVDFVDIDGLNDQIVLARALKGYHVLIVAHTPYFGAEFLKHNKDVVLILRYGIGYDNIDIHAAEREGVIVARLPNYIEREAVAEHTLALMLAALRRLTLADRDLREGRVKPGVYDEYVLEKLTGPANLSELTIGIVGLGNIGSRVAEILVKGFGAKVLAYDPYVKPELAKRLGVKLASSIEELISQVDILTIHAPLTQETYHMINRNVLSKAKRGLILVNTARGAIIDTKALLWALDEGIVSMAALDVFEEEPLPPNHPLLKRENVIVTPHIAVFVHTTLRKMFEHVVNAAIAYAEGRPLDEYVVVVARPKAARPNPFQLEVS